MSIKKVKLEEICNSLHQGLNTAGEKIIFEEKGFPVIQTRNITSNGIDVKKNLKYLSKSDWEKYREKYRPKVGDIFFTNIGTIGKTALVTEDLDYIIHWNIFKIRTDPLVCIPKYLKLYLDFLTSQNYFNNLRKGGTVNFVTKKMISNAYIYLPPLSEQNRIVNKLDNALREIDVMISDTNKSQSNLELIMSRYLHHTFSLKDNFFRGTIKDFCSIISGRTVNKNLEKNSGDLPYLKVADMNIKGNENEITTSTRFLDSNGVNKKNIISKGAIIFPKRGGAIATNKKRITATEIAVDLNIMTVTPKDGLNSKLLFYYFLSIDLGRLGSGSSVPQINNYDIEPLEINFPSDLFEQEKLVFKLDLFSNTIKTLKDIYKNKIRNLSNLKSIILNKEFNQQYE